MRPIRLHHRIRFRLLLVALTLLGIPWLGYLFIVESEAFLRNAQLQSLKATANSAANLTLAEDSALYGVARADSILTFRNLYLHAFPRAPQIDGYRDEWPGIADNFATLEAANGEFAVHVFAGHHGGALYLLIGVDDRTTRYGSDGDALDLALVTEDGTDHVFRIRPAGPGWVTAGPLQKRDALAPETAALASSLRGEWQNASSGYTVELRLPKNGLADRLALRYFDADTQRYVASSPLFPEAEIGELVSPNDALAQRLGAITPPSTRIWVTDHQGYVLALAGALDVDAPKSPGETRLPWFISDLARRVLGRDADITAEISADRSQLFMPPVVDALGGEAATLRRARPWGDAIVVSAAVPIRGSDGVRGAVLVEQTTNAILSIQDLALQRLFAAALLLFAITSLGLLAFASLLATRISRLNHDLETAVNADGRIIGELKPSQAKDEIGEITRTLSQTLHRLFQRHRYLEGTALQIETQIEATLHRLRQVADATETASCSAATTRELDALDDLLAELHEVGEADQRLPEAALGRFDLVGLAQERIAAHEARWPGSRITLSADGGPFVIDGMSRLLATALDKLLQPYATDPNGALCSAHITIDECHDSIRLTIRGESGVAAAASDHLPRLACAFHGGTLHRTADEADGGRGLVIELPSAGQ